MLKIIDLRGRTAFAAGHLPGTLLGAAGRDVVAIDDSFDHAGPAGLTIARETAA